MANLKGRIDQFMHEAGGLIENSLNIPEILEAVAVYGYTAEKLQTAKKLWEEVSGLNNSQLKETGEARRATEDVEKAWNGISGAYIRTLKIARIALAEETEARASMRLDGSRKQSLTGWLKDAKAFYENLTSQPQLMEKMTAFGYTSAKLNAEYQLVKDLEAKSYVQLKETGEAQKATDLRNEKLDELAEWVSDYRAVVKVALEDDPQQMEKVGILARSGKVYHKKESSEETPTTEPQPA